MKRRCDKIENIYEEMHDDMTNFVADILHGQKLAPCARSKFGIQPTIYEFKIAQNFFERCLSKGHLFCFRMLYLSHHGQ